MFQINFVVKMQRIENTKHKTKPSRNKRDGGKKSYAFELRKMTQKQNRFFVMEIHFNTEKNALFLT